MWMQASAGNILSRSLFIIFCEESEAKVVLLSTEHLPVFLLLLKWLVREAPLHFNAFAVAAGNKLTKFERIHGYQRTDAL